jgi:hypothetical protein
MTNDRSFAELLAEWMAARNLNGRTAAPLVGVSHETVYTWLRGGLPPRTRLVTVSAALGIDQEMLAAVVLRDRQRHRPPTKLRENAVDKVLQRRRRHNASSVAPDPTKTRGYP